MPNPSHRSFDSESQRLVVDNAKLGHDFAYIGSPLSKFIDEQQEKIEKLQAENERLRKAGDALCESPYLYETDQAVIAWRAAKGVQP